MASWRDLVAGHVQQVVSDRQANPGIQNFGQIVRLAMSENLKKAGEVRAQGNKERNIALQSGYNAYPQAAAEAAGMEIPAVGAAGPAAIEGLDPYETKIGPGGETTRTFRPPQDVTADDLVELYQDYVAETQKANVSAFAKDEAGKLIQYPIVPYKQWMRQNFPNYIKTAFPDVGENDYYFDKPEGIDAYKWELATPEQRKELLDMIESRQLR